MNNWFEVDRKGLKALQEGKPKSFILRELVQNAFDEDITECYVDIKKDKRDVTITVEDDSPEGFKDITHAYTLFADTYKRRDPTKRGRFNLGEKQVFAICDFCMVETTKGTIVFDDKGRHRKNKKTDKGSKITIRLKMTNDEHFELTEDVHRYLPPKHIKLWVENEPRKYKEPFKSFEAILTTELQKDGVMRKTQRKTTVNVHKSKEPYIYEMGLPVCPIECDYNIDVQQKIPLSTDREKVSQAFLQDIYSEVLNHTFDDIPEERSSQAWIREGMSDDRITEKAVRTVIEKRFGEKVVVATPNDPNSVDDALSEGYRVIRGRELSVQEWENIKRFDTIKSSHEKFGHGTASTETVKELTDNQEKFKELAKKIAKYCLGHDITVEFVKFDGVMGQYGGRTLTVNLKHCGNGFFGDLGDQLDFIIHELGHEKGHHTEKAYHESLTEIGAGLILKAIEDPRFFEVE